MRGAARRWVGTLGLRLSRTLDGAGQLRVVARAEDEHAHRDGADRQHHAEGDEQRPAQARLLVRRDAGRERPLRPFGGTPAAAASSAIAACRSAANSSRSDIAS